MTYAFGGFLLLIFAGMPIVLALGVSALLAITMLIDVPLTIVAQRVYGGVHSFSLMAIPFFTAAGILMAEGGIARRFVDLAAALVGWVTGSLYLVTIVTGTGLAAISGSGSADTAAVGSILSPEMRRRGYDIDFVRRHRRRLGGARADHPAEHHHGGDRHHLESVHRGRYSSAASFRGC